MKKIIYVLIISLCMFLFSACSINTSSRVIYKNADKYTAGNAVIENGDIKELKIDWINGDITINYGLNLEVTETYNKEEVSDDLKVHYYFNDNVLYIEPCKSGYVHFGNLKKSLIITIPENITLDILDIDNVSANVNIDVKVKKIEIDSVSANYNINSNCEINDIDIDSVSGNFTINCESFKEIDIDNVSGNFFINVSNDILVKVKYNTTSGKVYNDISGDSNDHLVEFDSVSGNLHINKLEK